MTKRIHRTAFILRKRIEDPNYDEMVEEIPSTRGFVVDNRRRYDMPVFKFKVPNWHQLRNIIYDNPNLVLHGYIVLRNVTIEEPVHYVTWFFQGRSGHCESPPSITLTPDECNAISAYYRHAPSLYMRLLADFLHETGQIGAQKVKIGFDEEGET